MNGWLYAVLTVVLAAVLLATILSAFVLLAVWLGSLTKDDPPDDDGPDRRSLLAHDTPRRRSQRLRRAHIILPPVALHMPTQPADYADYPAQGEPPSLPVDVLPPFPDLDQAHIEAMRDRWAAIPLDMH